MVRAWGSRTSRRPPQFVNPSQSAIRRARKRSCATTATGRLATYVFSTRAATSYADALSLARQVVAATGRTLAGGEARSWNFLFRTPAPVEAGLRALIAERLAGAASVRKGRRILPPGNFTINPDLVFESAAVGAIGDVKYKVTGPEWERSDVYEVVALAAGHRVSRAVLAAFSSPPSRSLLPVTVGDHVVTSVVWPADPELDAEVAAMAFTDAIAAWFDASDDVTHIAPASETHAAAPSQG